MDRNGTASDLADRAYYDSVLYKMVFILSGFRILYGAAGHDFAIQLKKSRPDLFSFKNSTLIDLVDEGLVVLEKKQVQAYSDYVCMLYEVPARLRDSFYGNLLDYASSQMPNDYKSFTQKQKALIHNHAIMHLMTLIGDHTYEALLKIEVGANAQQDANSAF